MQRLSSFFKNRIRITKARERAFPLDFFGDGRRRFLHKNGRENTFQNANFDANFDVNLGAKLPSAIYKKATPQRILESRFLCCQNNQKMPFLHHVYAFLGAKTSILLCF
jgi:hypothetical protein